MRLQLSACAALFATPAFAHSGHTEFVDGHTHSFFDLMALGAGLSTLAIAGVVIVVFQVSRRND